MLRGEGALPDDEVVDNGVGRVIAVLTTDEELGVQDTVRLEAVGGLEQRAIDPNFLGGSALDEGI